MVSGRGGITDVAVEVELTTAPDVEPIAVIDPDGRPVPFDVADIGTAKVFEADLDLLPDTRDVRRHRVGIFARDVPAWGWATYRVRLGAREPGRGTWNRQDGRSVTCDGWRIDVADDATLTVTDIESERVFLHMVPKARARPDMPAMSERMRGIRVRRQGERRTVL